MTRTVPLRERFWFLPAVLCIVGAVSALALVELDHRVTISTWRLRGLVYEVGASGSRDLLGAIASSVLTAAATTFSITMAVLALTTSNYGPRLVRNFMADRGNQIVLGTFLATFLYALLVLRSVQDDGSSSGSSDAVPHLAVNVAVLLAVVDIALLVYFIHHISDSIQISTLSRRVREDLCVTVESQYPEPDPDQDLGDGVAADTQAAGAGAAGTGATLPEGWRTRARAVRSRDDGYVASIDVGRLTQVAERYRATIELTCVVGDHLVREDVLAYVRTPDDGRVADDEAEHVASRKGVAEARRDLEDGVRSAVAVRSSRTPHQDVRFAVLQLIEMAVRALSPGTNDPFTAMNALDDLAASLSVMARRDPPAPVRRGVDGQVRLVVPVVGVGELLSEVYDYLRCYALDAPAVLHRALDLGQTVGLRARDPQVRRLLDEEVSALVDAYASTGPFPRDLHRLAARAHQVQATLLHPPSGDEPTDGPPGSSDTGDAGADLADGRRSGPAGQGRADDAPSSPTDNC